MNRFKAYRQDGKLPSMAQRGNTTNFRRPMTIHAVAEAVGVYPPEAYEFVQKGLHFTVVRTYGAQGSTGARHVTGQQLAMGLRDYALMNWGIMARAVLAKWNITSTYDFGRIVFAMVEGGILQKTEEDDLEDFRGVYDFSTFDEPYRISSKL